MKAIRLIPKDSALYRRRLVRELNSHTNGFYVTMFEATYTMRCSAARIHKGVFQVRRVSLDCEWLNVSNTSVFFDVHNSLEIVASREKRGQS